MLSIRDSILIQIPKNWLKIKGWKNKLHPNSKQKRSELAILMSNKIDFK